MNFEYLQNLSFLNPWVLSFLVLLPVIWFLLRVTPPPASVIALSTARFLQGLVAQSKTPSKTPWWILLLRILILALIIVALSRPILNKTDLLNLQGVNYNSVRVVVENGRQSALNWTKIKDNAENILNQAQRDNLEVWICVTALRQSAGGVSDYCKEAMTATDALAFVKGIEPLPWDSEYNKALKSLMEISPEHSVVTYFMGSGTRSQGFDEFVSMLQSGGSLRYFMPEKQDMPAMLVVQNDSIYKKINMHVQDSLKESESRSFDLIVLSEDGKIIDSVKASSEEEIIINIPDEYSSKVKSAKISGFNSAQAVHYFADSANAGKKVVIVTGNKENSVSLLEGERYLEKAFESFTNAVKTENITDAINLNPSVIVIHKQGVLGFSDYEYLIDWIESGGTFVSFADQDLIADYRVNKELYDMILPVSLINDSRAMNGVLAWGEPAEFSEFSKSSPFYGIEINDMIKVRKQVLADPSDSQLNEKIWARLADNTPLVTASAKGAGITVLFHTTAGPDWSDIALSGTFVQMLKRIVEISGNSIANKEETNGIFKPILLTDAFGNQVSDEKAMRNIKGIDGKDILTVKPSSETPPGIYDSGGYRVSINLGERLKEIESVNKLPSGVEQINYSGSKETELAMPLFVLACLLFFVDWLISAMIGSGVFLSNKMQKIAGFLLLLVPLTIFCNSFYINSAFAQNYRNLNEINPDMKYANGFYLAYIKTNNPQTDEISRKGLENLGAVLGARTSAVPDGVVGVSPETDSLALFPIIYWPITSDQNSLSDEGVTKIRSYLESGGNIIFDLKDKISTMTGISGSEASEHLRRITSGMNLPAIAPLNEQHVLHKTYYLLDDFAGKYEGGEIWVEKQINEDKDGVSPIILGSHDWASAWANPTSERKSEMAFRSGINFIMYALTGNYKADQLHAKEILKRMK